MSRYSNPFVQYLSGTADVLDGNQLFFFSPGTTTPKDTYSDSGLTTANSNPVVADAAGRIPDIFLDGTYKVVLKDKDGVTIETADPIGETTGGQFELWLNDNTYNIPDIVAGSDDNFYRSLVDSNQGNDPTSSPAQWEQIEFERIYNSNVTYALGDRSIGSDGMQYFSLIASNTGNDPVNDTTSTNWRAADQIRSADASGTVDAITATYIPAVAVFKDGLILRARSLGANTSPTPTFSPNGLLAKTIVKSGNQALLSGDISLSGHEIILVYNSTNDNWELTNPAVNVDDQIAHAWVNFDGTGSVSIRDSFNVTSITDNGIGDYTVNFTNALSDTNYCVNINTETSLAAGTFVDLCGVVNGGIATGSVRITNINSTDGTTERDADALMVSVHGGN